MKEQWSKLQVAWDGLAIRERALVMGAVIAGCYGAVDVFLLQPMDLERERLESELTRTIDETERLDTRARLLAEQIEKGIPGPIDREEQALRRQIERLEARIDELMGSMIPPGEVTRMLEALLAEESELSLVRLTSLEPPRPSRQPGAAPEEATTPAKPEIFRHAFRLELEGSYLATLHYLEAIESLSWDLSWDRMVYEVVDYPRARIAIELHTVSDAENWIGV